MTGVLFECRLDVLDTTERGRYEALRTQVAEWIALERRCCPFLALGLDWSDGDAVWLRLTGRAGVKAFLADRLMAGRGR